MPSQKPAFDPVAAWIKSYWKGEQPLWAAFWIWGVFVGFWLDTLFVPTFKAAIEVATYAHQDPLGWLTQYHLLAIVMFALVYSVWNFVSVWRSAKGVWGWLARGFYVFVAAVMLTWWGATFQAFFSIYDSEHETRTPALEEELLRQLEEFSDGYNR